MSMTIVTSLVLLDWLQYFSPQANKAKRIQGRGGKIYMTFNNDKCNPSTIASPHSFSNDVSENIVSSIATLFSKTRVFLQKALQRMDEPTISQVKTRSGELLWHVYDPLSRQSVVLGSEAEVRTWLEQQFRSIF